MKQALLVLMPVLFFVGALLSVNNGNMQNSDSPVQLSLNIPLQSNQQTLSAVQPNSTEPNPTAPQPASTTTSPVTSGANQKRIVYVDDVSECTDGSGTIAYVIGNTTQIQPIPSKSAQCPEVVALVQGGINYFGCANGGKIILDCDWFAQQIGDENFGNNTNFGSSYVQDFHVPDISKFTCKETQVDQSLLLVIQGNICDLHNLVGNLDQMHS